MSSAARRIHLLLALALAGSLASTACTRPPAATDTGPAPTQAPTASPALSPQSAAPVAMLKGLTTGDRACYVALETPAGEQSLEGDFELCTGGAHDASALIGQRITYTTQKAKVLAASCEGDADCGKSDEVDLVMTIVAAPG